MNADIRIRGISSDDLAAVLEMIEAVSRGVKVTTHITAEAPGPAPRKLTPAARRRQQAVATFPIAG